MQISPISFQVKAMNISKTKKQQDNAPLTFKGDDKEPSYFSLDYSALMQHPMMKLQSQLIEDGFSGERLKGIYTVYKLSINDILGKIEQTAKTGELAPLDDCVPIQRSAAGIQAMYEVYQVMRKDFLNDDVRAYAHSLGKFSKYLVPSANLDENEVAKEMVLDTLASVGQTNKKLAFALLEDESFDNARIGIALNLADNQKRVDMMLKVLSAAQEKGYNKEFSSILVSLMRNATDKNFPAIVKILDEQDYLLENTNFAMFGLKKFLHSKSTLIDFYVQNDDLTLKEIDEIIEIAKKQRTEDEQEDNNPQ